MCVHPRVMIIKRQNGVGKSTLLYALKQRILGNGVTKEDVIFISPSGESQCNEHTEADVHGDEPSYRITSVLSRLEIARRNIIATSALLDNNDRSPAFEYTSVSYIYEPLNKLLNMLLPHLKF
jgi:hypothetical protein